MRPGFRFPRRREEAPVALRVSAVTLRGKGGRFLEAGIPILLRLGRAVLLQLLPAGALLGQGALVEGRMEARLPPGGGAVPVVMVYRLETGSGADTLGLTLLAPGETRVTGLRVSMGGETIPVGLNELRPRYWAGSLPLPPLAGLDLRLTYEVEGAFQAGGRVVVPVVAVDWVPPDPHPRTFLATVQVPPGLAVLESFPTSVLERPEAALGGSYRMGLQAPPSMLVLRTVVGDPPPITVERLLDLLVVALLLLLGGVGIRSLRRGDAWGRGDG